MKLFKNELDILIEEIKKRVPDSLNVRCFDTKNNFLRGKLYTFKFDTVASEANSIRICTHDNRVDIYESDDMLLAVVGETHKSMDFPFSTPAAIAILLTLTICGLALWGTSPIPDILANALTVILGFYFG